MTTKPVAHQKAKKLSVDWNPDLQFSLSPKVVSAGKKRLLTSCTISISTHKLPAFSPKPAARVEP